jgi:hypothetical protein
MVSWHEAGAFCRWLESQLRESGESPRWMADFPGEEDWSRQRLVLKARGFHGKAGKRR